jgi:hypothetical protein
MKKVTYVTVIVHSRARRSNAGKLFTDRCGLFFEARVQGIARQFHFSDEGTTWARGWHTKDAKALEAAQALT